MSVPEGYEKLAVLGISYKGNYDETLTYNYLNAVYYEGSTYVALKDNVTTIPANDGVNWKYLARGFIAHLLSELTAIDNQGLLDVAGSAVDAQDLIDKIADELVNGDTANNTVTFESSDSTTADSWTDVAVLATGEKHSSLFAKISTMFKNIRYIYTHFIKSENILETLEEIVANTQSGKVAGALAVKELNSNFVKSANWETLFEDNNGVAQNNGIYFDTKGYKVFAIQVSSESLIFVRLWTTDLQNISAGIPVLINNGTKWISVNRIIRFDSYSDHWHIQQLADFDTAGNSYSDGRKVYAIYGVK